MPRNTNFEEFNCSAVTVYEDLNSASIAKVSTHLGINRRSPMNRINTYSTGKRARRIARENHAGAESDVALGTKISTVSAAGKKGAGMVRKESLPYPNA